MVTYRELSWLWSWFDELQNKVLSQESQITGSLWMVAFCLLLLPILLHLFIYSLPLITRPYLVPVCVESNFLIPLCPWDF